MANDEQVGLIREKGVEAWNEWRNENPTAFVDLAYADFSNLDLNGIILSDANLMGAKFEKANLNQAVAYRAEFVGVRFNDANLTDVDFFEAGLTHTCFDNAKMLRAKLHRTNLNDASLIGAVMRGVGLTESNLIDAKLDEADLTEANLEAADLSRASLRDANLCGANLSRCNFVETNFERANLENCHVYGVSAWNVNLQGANQTNLTITGRDESVVTVDNLEVAQFMYLILNNRKLRDVINTITSKAVLILGRFTPERKEVLDAIREELRRLHYVPIMFDFEKPSERDFTETIMTLAGMCRFIVADITEPSSSPLELQVIIPNYKIPFVPIIKQGERSFAMFKDLVNSHQGWVLDLLEYDTLENLIKDFELDIVNPALELQEQLTLQKAQPIRTRKLRSNR